MNIEELIKSGEVIFLSHFGLITQPLITAIIEALEKEDDLDENIHFSHKLYVVLIEIAQNIMHYAKEGDYKAFIVVGKEKDTYYVLGKNLVDKKDKEKIEKNLGEIVVLNKDEIKALYKERRENGLKSHKKGAGIGFLEMAKVSKKIEFGFEEFKDKYIFSLKVYVD